MFQTKVVEKFKTRFYSIYIYIYIYICVCILNCVVYEIMWKNVVQPDRLQMTIWHMYIVGWVLKATNTILGYGILTEFPAAIVAKMCLPVMLYVHFVSYYLGMELSLGFLL